MQHFQAGSASSALTQGVQQLAGSPVAMQRCSSSAAAATAAARRLFDAAAAGCAQTACRPQLESAWSSNMAVLDQTCASAVQQEAPQTPPAVPAPQNPTFRLIRRVVSHCQHSAGMGRACRMLPGLAPCNTRTQQQLSAWLTLQETELTAAANLQLKCFSPM